eukprot:Sspe_Gene.26384::Locus_10890_Transcript_1_1_Confidence_1.000_Length_1048::g.26384::m.26384
MGEPVLVPVPPSAPTGRQAPPRRRDEILQRCRTVEKDILKERQLAGVTVTRVEKHLSRLQKQAELQPAADCFGTTNPTRERFEQGKSILSLLKSALTGREGTEEERERTQYRISVAERAADFELPQQSFQVSRRRVFQPACVPMEEEAKDLPCDKGRRRMMVPTKPQDAKEDLGHLQGTGRRRVPGTHTLKSPFDPDDEGRCCKPAIRVNLAAKSDVSPLLIGAEKPLPQRSGKGIAGKGHFGGYPHLPSIGHHGIDPYALDSKRPAPYVSVFDSSSSTLRRGDGFIEKRVRGRHIAP